MSHPRKHAHVRPLVGDLRSSAKMLGDGGKQLVGAPSHARHVDHDGGGPLLLC
jgi:hypothetical protein